MILPPRHRLTALLTGVLLLVTGAGCVSWDPIFRGSMGLWSLLSRLF